ncbi:MAG: deoxynucleoside kinase [Pseudomonadota bacterium]|nr:deoxynucleoside kinase [Pseudomonadota bacterium]
MPRHIAIEGPIGVGKTTLARRLASTFDCDLLLEAPEQNPFLPRFYRNPRAVALQTQLFFLFQRVEQLRAVHQSDLFQPARVADFLFAKDRLFAELNLDPDELALYLQVHAHLEPELPRPDFVIYLQAPTEVLLKRIQMRGIAHERAINADYLNRLNETYARYFLYFEDAPLLIVNAATIDFANRDQDLQALVELIRERPRGRHYFNPSPQLL